MARRFLRRVRVNVGDDAQRFVIEDLLIRFDIRRQTTATPASGYVEIWNLSDRSETRIRARGETVLLEAGYGDRLEAIFLGDVRRIRRESTETDRRPEWSPVEISRQGQDRITRIYVGGAVSKQAAAVFSRTYEGQVAVRTIVIDMIAALGLDVGDLSLIPDDTKTNFRYNGGLVGIALERLIEPYGIRWYEEGGRANFTRTGQSGDDRRDGIRISERTGLIGVPTRTDDGLRLRTLLDHRLRLDKIVRVESSVLSEGAEGSPTNERAAEYTGSHWKIVEVRHAGNNRANEFYTEIDLRPL